MWLQILVLGLLLLPLQDSLALPVFAVAREPCVKINCFFYHIEDGWHYTVNRIREGTTYYKCVFYERGCRGRAILDEVEGFVHVDLDTHNHDVDMHYPDEIALRRRIINRCLRLDYCGLQTIIAEESNGFPPEVVARVTYARMRTAMLNARLRNFPPTPAELIGLTEILMDPQYHIITLSQDGLDNIYGGSVTDPDGEHHILFISHRMVQRMRSFRVLHADGTFRAVPINNNYADQVFCIVGVWHHHIIPLAWALMSSRTEVAYTSVLRLLQQLLGADLELSRIITDFETGQQNAWENVFAGIVVQGCLWHLARAYMQEAAQLNLIAHMRRIEQVKRIIRLTLALPLLPANMILQGFVIILQEARNEGNYIFRIVRPFLEYVRRYWVGRPWRRQRMCVYASEQRTNNVCESHNRMLRDAVGTHSNVYRFIGGLVRLEQMAHNSILALEEGRRVSRGRRRTAIMNDRRIQQLSDDLFNPPGPVRLSILRFLRTASHLMQNMVEEVVRERVRQPNRP